MEKLYIDKPGMVLGPKNQDQNVIIIWNEGPTVTIALSENERCTLKNIEISFAGNNHQMCFFQ